MIWSSALVLHAKDCDPAEAASIYGPSVCNDAEAILGSSDTDRHFQRRCRHDLSSEERPAPESIVGDPVILAKRGCRVSRVRRPCHTALSSLPDYDLSLMTPTAKGSCSRSKFPGIFLPICTATPQRLRHDGATLGNCLVAYASNDKITKIVEAVGMQPHRALPKDCDDR